MSKRQKTVEAWINKKQNTISVNTVYKVSRGGVCLK